MLNDYNSFAPLYNEESAKIILPDNDFLGVDPFAHWFDKEPELFRK